MTPELIAMLGGGTAGFIMRLIGAQAEAQGRTLEIMVKRQAAADDSSDRAAARSGVWVRRIFVACILFAVILAPFVLSLTDAPVTIQQPGRGGLFALLGLSRPSWESLQGFVLLPEVRQSMLAIVGFYFGSSQIR